MERIITENRLTGMQLFSAFKDFTKVTGALIFPRDCIKSESYRRKVAGTGPCHPSVRHKYGYGP